MKTNHRDYSEEAGDFNRLARFFTMRPVDRRIMTTWCLGRLVDWKYALYERKRTFASFCEENAHLWFDGFGELAGFAISEGGDTGFHILTLEGYRFLYEDMLNWVLTAWQSRVAEMGTPLSTELTEFQLAETRVLEKYGIRAREDFFTRRFDLTGALMPLESLKPGFTIVDLKTHPDYRAQGILRANAFQKKTSLTDEELGNRLKYYNNSIHGPVYHPQTDICVMAEDGRFVAGCEALINAHCLEADIERVCTHSEFRQQGFARAVILECLHRLKEMGIRSAYITGYSQQAIALYGSLGARDEVRSTFFEGDL